MRERAVAEFQKRFGRLPKSVVRAPGRVNLLGGHTDYNEGYVLPLAIDQAAWVAAARRTIRQVQIAALDLDENTEFSLDPVPPRQGDWADYPRGVAWALQRAGYQLEAIAAVLTSDVPVGAGLSSSAAVEVAFAWTWRVLSQLELDRTEAARLCQQAENEYVGLRCGVMDQMASAWGRAHHALLLDCRTLEVRPVPLPPSVAIVVADTKVRRELAASEYNRRRQECEAAVRILARHEPGIRALRDLTLESFDRLAHHLPDLLRRRVRHVVTANARVLAAAAALEEGDLVRVGDAMRRCHESLRDDYEVSSLELDLLADAASGVPGCYGARMTGGGFGGCVVALAEQAAVEDLTWALEQAYVQRFNHRPAIYVTRAADGVSLIP
ncbi:MAG: galactokinase [Anaerolineae bacterium]|jgi:galactokinase